MNRPVAVNTWTRALPLSLTYTSPLRLTAIFPLTYIGSVGSSGVSSNSPGPLPGLPHRRSTFPDGEITVTCCAESVTYRLPSGPIATAVGPARPSDRALQRATTWNGTGSARECRPAFLVAFCDVAEEVVPQPAGNAMSATASPSTARCRVIDAIGFTLAFRFGAQHATSGGKLAPPGCLASRVVASTNPAAA